MGTETEWKEMEWEVLEELVKIEEDMAAWDFRVDSWRVGWVVVAIVFKVWELGDADADQFELKVLD